MSAKNHPGGYDDWYDPSTGITFARVRMTTDRPTGDGKDHGRGYDRATPDPTKHRAGKPGSAAKSARRR